MTQQHSSSDTISSSNLCAIDFARLSKLRSKIVQRQKEHQPVSKLVAEFEQKHTMALARFEARQANIPKIQFPANLPIAEKQQEIAELIENNPVVILAGETGSGKTTQLPKICLSIGRGVRGLIGHTQPRRIAASTVASRIAEELDTPLGGSVGYQVRFTDHTAPETYIKLMTDGILLAEIQQDPLLLKYDTLIIDEAHERSLNIDFLLGYLKGLVKKRSDLKIIVTSATIDLEKFSKHFDNAPIIEVSGRTYPVDVFYRPWQDEFDDVTDSIVNAIGELLELSKGEGGDILIFLSGEREIRETSHGIKKAGFQHLEVLPLYARLSLSEQNKVFKPHKGRRVVLATNVAETSITVPGIRFVIDPGTARISRYSVRTKVQRLPVEPVSQASANQRKGRCGRVSEGICIRLYSEEDFLGRPEYTDAEIQRTNLAAVILQMLQLRIGDVRKFPFIDRPENKLINDGFKLLEELQAVDQNGRVTNVGRLLQRIPLDPRLARAMVDATRFGCLKEILIIVSALSLQDPRERPQEKQQASDEKHRRFWDENSDFIAYINLWNYVEAQRQELSTNQFRKLCQREYLNFMRLKEWRDLHHQLRLVSKELKYNENKEPSQYDSIHRSLLVGMISNVGQREEDTRKTKRHSTDKHDKYDQKSKVSRDYLGTRNKKFQIFPGSSQNKKRPKWIMAAEYIETSQLFCHCVAKIEPEWVLSASNHLVKHHYYEPHYDTKSGQVKAYDRVSLFGLVLVEKRRVNYSDIDPATAREVFIRAALLEGGYEKRGKGLFFSTNKTLVAEIYDLESKSRRRDILVDDEEIFAFYNERIPKDICNLAGFEHWRKKAEEDNPDLLIIPYERLTLRSAADVTEAQFPNMLDCAGLTLPLKYHFEPNHCDDGVSIVIPAELLHIIEANYLEWLVPGLLRDKCIALVKNLPKRIRKNFVPVPQFVDKVLNRMKPSNRPLMEVLGEELSHISNIKIEPEDWQDVRLENFYLMNVLIVDDYGAVIDRSRDVDELRKKYKSQVQTTLKNVGNTIEKTGIVQWDFGKLETEVQLNKGAIKVKGFPALVDNKDSVAMEVKDNPREAEYLSYFGCLRLASIALAHTRKYLTKQLLVGKDLGLAVVDLGKKDDVKDDIILAAIGRACFGEARKPVYSQQAFNEAVEKGRPNLVAIAQEYEDLLVNCLKQIVAIKKALKSSKNMLTMAFAYADVNNQLQQMFYPGFMVSTSWYWLEQFPRYLQAIEIRLEKAPLNVRKDQMAIDQIAQHWEKHDELLHKQGTYSFAMSTEWQDYRWMIEELRVSVFAQSLKTLLPVSDKRLGKKWREEVLGPVNTH